MLWVFSLFLQRKSPDYVIESGLITLVGHELDLLKKSGSFETKFNIEGKNVYKGFGLGIRSMHDRAILISGDFRLISSEGKGAKVIISIPNSVETVK